MLIVFHDFALMKETLHRNVIWFQMLNQWLESKTDAELLH